MRQFVYDFISNVILSLSVTFRLTAVINYVKAAPDSVADYIKSVDNLSDSQGNLALFNLKSEFASK
jgi:hypothetical protein